MSSKIPSHRTTMVFERDFVHIHYNGGERLSVFLPEVTAISWNRDYVYLWPRTTKVFFVPRGGLGVELQGLKEAWVLAKKR